MLAKLSILTASDIQKLDDGSIEKLKKFIHFLTNVDIERRNVLLNRLLLKIDMDVTIAKQIINTDDIDGITFRPSEKSLIALGKSISDRHIPLTPELEEYLWFLSEKNNGRYTLHIENILCFKCYDIYVRRLRNYLRKYIVNNTVIGKMLSAKMITRSDLNTIVNNINLSFISLKLFNEDASFGDLFELFDDCDFRETLACGHLEHMISLIYNECEKHNIDFNHQLRLITNNRKVEGNESIYLIPFIRELEDLFIYDLNGNLKLFLTEV